MSTSTTKPTAICANRAITPLATNASSQLAIRQSSSHLDAADYPRPVAVQLAVNKPKGSHVAARPPRSWTPTSLSPSLTRTGLARSSNAEQASNAGRRTYTIHDFEGSEFRQRAPREGRDHEFRLG